MCVCVGLGDEWGHRIVNATSREKELGSQILQVTTIYINGVARVGGGGTTSQEVSTHPPLFLSFPVLFSLLSPFLTFALTLGIYITEGKK